MDILEIIDDREQAVSENISKPFACPSEGCGKVWDHSYNQANRRLISCYTEFQSQV